MGLTILQWNVKHYHNRLPHIHQALDIYKPDIICLQETWLKPHISSKLTGFQDANRKDRDNRVGGGVVVFPRQGIPTIPLIIHNNLEICANKFFLPSSNITVASLYIAPDTSHDNIKIGLDSIAQQLTPPYIICMDSNAHHSSWGSNFSDKRGYTIDNWLTSNNLILLNTTEPTYLHPNSTLTHIDLTIATPDLVGITDWKPHYETLNSDHFPICISIGLDSQVRQRPSRWRFDEANWEKYREEIKLPHTFTDPNTANNEILHSIKTAATITIPFTSSNTNKKYCKNWWNQKCSEDHKNKTKTWNKYNKNKGNMILWLDYKKAEAIFRQTVLAAKKDTWSKYLASICEGASSQEVWQKIKIIKGGRSNHTKPLMIDDKIIAKPENITNAFGEYYYTIYNSISPDPFFEAHKSAIEFYPLTFNHNSDKYYNKPFTIPEIKKALSNCKSKSAGPDTLSFILFQQIPPTQLTNLLAFYNYIWNNGIPTQWKHSYLIPILKPGKISTSPNSYRLIALTNCICKIMERMINKRLQQYLEQNSIIKPYQSGFRTAHSTLDPLVSLQSDISLALIDKQYCIAIFLDITKAFDNVWHRGILDILHDMNMSGNLPRFIQDFLSGRTYQVKIENHFSNSKTITNGVPQGSVLSPTLFSLVINNVFSRCPAHVRYSLYADDGAFWVKTNDLAQGLRTAQHILDNLNLWSHQSGLQFAADKTKAIIFSHKYKINPLPLSINGHPIEYVSQIKFLGVIFDKRMTWRPHIQHISDKCQPDLRLLRVVSHNKWGADFSSLKKLYTSIVLPKITYADFLRTSTAKTTNKILTRVQYAAARIMLGALRCTPACTLEAEAGLMPLSLISRRNSAIYSCRVLTIPSHPVGYSLRSEEFDRLVTKDSPAISNMRRELFLSGLSPVKDFPILPLSDRLNSYTFNSTYNLHITNKEDLTPTQWQHQYNTLTKETYQSHTHVFTDGSVMHDATGCGVWSSNFTLMARLSDRCSIFTAELYSIYIALNYILATKQTQPHIVFSDSLSALTAIDNPTQSSHYLVHHIHNTIEKIKTTNITLEWIPSHQDIHGNEMADKYAKAATKLNSITYTQLSYQDCKKFIYKDFINLWHYQYRGSRCPTLKIQSTPLNTYPTTLTRPLQIAYTRLRLNTTTLTHQHLFLQEPQPICNCTTTTPHLTVRHVLLDCLHWSAERASLHEACKLHSIPLTMETLLSDKRMTSFLMKYLHTTNLLKKI